MGKEILVFADIQDGKLRQVTLEVLSVAQSVKPPEGRVTVAVFGQVSESILETLAHYGAERILSVRNESLNEFTVDGFVKAWTQVIASVSPAVILTGHTSIGKDVSPRIAAKLQLGLISDCVQLERKDDELIFTRPIYAGKAFEKKKMKEDHVVFATLRPNNFPISTPDPKRKASVEPFSIVLYPQDLRTITKELVKKSSSGVDLTEAKIIVAGGRGVKSANGFQPLKELAEVLGAAIGASRGACDAGYCDYSLQIGQTGKVVTPDLYIACGISGAIQHLAGMSNSKVIVAINKDPDAPIFQVADYGIVGDLFEVVPLLTEEFKKYFSKIE